MLPSPTRARSLKASHTHAPPKTWSACSTLVRLHLTLIPYYDCSRMCRVPGRSRRQLLPGKTGQVNRTTRLNHMQRGTKPMTAFLFSALIAVGAICGTAGPREIGITRDAKAPGSLIDLGGYKLHIKCEGDRQNGKPPVILIHGGGDFSFDWALVIPGAAQFTHVCAYDQAGQAWSDPGP